MCTNVVYYVGLPSSIGEISPESRPLQHPRDPNGLRPSGGHSPPLEPERKDSLLLNQLATKIGYEKGKADISAELTRARASITELELELTTMALRLKETEQANKELESANEELERAKGTLQKAAVAAKLLATSTKKAAQAKLDEALRAERDCAERRMLRVVEQELRVRAESAEAAARLQMEAARAALEAATAEVLGAPAALEAALIENLALKTSTGRGPTCARST